MLHIVETIEKLIIRALVILLLLAMVLGTIELGRVTILEVFAPPFLLLDISKIFEGFGLALIILIGLELLKVLKLFLLEDKIKPEIIVEIAVIAICNKIITLDTKQPINPKEIRKFRQSDSTGSRFIQNQLPLAGRKKPHCCFKRFSRSAARRRGERFGDI
jgi:uncharacterized membrane protein (DUF373 family)